MEAEPKDILRAVSSAAYKKSQATAKQAEVDEKTLIDLTNRITQRLLATIKRGKLSSVDSNGREWEARVALRHPFANSITWYPSEWQKGWQERILNTCQLYCPEELRFVDVKMSRDFAMYDKDECNRCCGVLCCPCVALPFLMIHWNKLFVTLTIHSNGPF
jgi:hypothetical protein